MKMSAALFSVRKHDENLGSLEKITMYITLKARRQNPHILVRGLHQGLIRQRQALRILFEGLISGPSIAIYMSYSPSSES